MYTTAEERFAAAASPAAAAKDMGRGGGTYVDTPEGIERWRMLAVLHALKLQANTGIKIGGGKALRVARQDYGVTARTAKKAYPELRLRMIERGVFSEGG